MLQVRKTLVQIITLSFGLTMDIVVSKMLFQKLHHEM